MAFLGEVGNTFRIVENALNKKLNVILTEPNNGFVVVAPFVKPIKGVQTYILFTPKDGGELFQSNKTICYQDARIVLHNMILEDVNKDLNLCGPDCPPDAVRRIVIAAFESGLPSNKILRELANQYPDVYAKYGNYR